MTRSADNRRAGRINTWIVLLLCVLLCFPVSGDHPILKGNSLSLRSPQQKAVAGVVPAPIDENYVLLDRVEGDWVNLNPVQVRPMTITQNQIYAVSTYHSTVVHSDASLTPVDVFRTLWGPVSIATHVTPTDGPDSDRLLVVCQNSNALVVHNRLTGDIVDIVALPPRPADIVVKHDEHVALISTLGRNEVVEIDLLNLQGPQTAYSVPSEDPLFLTLTPQGEVLVSVNLSGNNSVVDRYPGESFNLQANVNSILDLDDPAVATSGLPDHDVFWIDRSGAGAVVPVARGMGTVLSAAAIDPTSPQQTALWQLNIEANNKNKTKQTEPDIQGQVSFNRLSRVVLASPLGSSVAQGSQHIDLDLANPSGNYVRGQSVGMPYSIDVSRGGILFVTGLLTDNVVVLDPAGNWITEWDLPKNCIPRQVELDPTETVALVYCAGTNEVPAYYLGTNPPTLIHGHSLDLGFDPTPAEIQEGRQLFYDGDFSEHNNASCATCHIEGGIDGLAWNLSNGEVDSKGPMTTQDLHAVNRLGPLHWRGEQQGSGLQRGMTVDFNDAFINLLGSTRKMSETRQGRQPSQFDKLEAFMLSLEHPANPNQNEDRILDDSIQPPMLGTRHQVASAITGQVEYVNSGCNGCHALPTGSNNEIVPDGILSSDPKARRHEIVIQPLLNTFTRSIHPDHPVNLVASGNQLYPRVGPGTSHSGNPRNLFHFIEIFLFNAQKTSEITNFIYQMDTGLAPAVHQSVLLNSQNLSAGQQRLNSYLIPQAGLRNADIGVFGRLTTGATSRITGWAYDRGQGDFIRDDGTRQPLSFFANQVTSAGDWFAFVGLPVGMGVGWAIDFDRDQLYNALERRTPVDGRYIVDWDGDGFWDGHEVLNGGDPFNGLVLPVDVTNPSFVNVPAGGLGASWTTAKVARLVFEPSELATYNLTLTPPAGTGLPTLSYTSNEPRLMHNVVVHNLYPGQISYNAALTVTDLAGLPSPTQNFTVQSGFFNDGPEVVVIDDLQWSSPPSGSGTVTFAAKTVVTKKTSGPPRVAAPNRVMVLRALINGKPATNANLTVPAGQPTAFCVNQLPYSAWLPRGGFPGPFIITGATNPSGITTINFTLSGLMSGDEVTLVPEFVSSLDNTAPICNGTTIDTNLNPNVPNVTFFVPVNWSFPDTPKQYRTLTFKHP